MLVETKVLGRFLDLVSLKGDCEIRECAFTSTEKGLTATLTNPAKTLALRGELLGDFSDLQAFGLEDVTLLKRLITVDSKEVDIKQDGNKLVLKQGNIKSKLILKNLEYVTTLIKEDSFKELLSKIDNDALYLDKDIINKILEYYTIFNDKLTLTLKGNKLSVLLNKEENEILLSFNVDTGEDFSITFSKILADCLGTIKSDVLIKAKSNSPIHINTKTDKYNLEYIIAPTSTDE